MNKIQKSSLERGMTNVSRRTLLAQLLALGVSRPAWGLGENSMLDVAELLIDGVSIARPRAWERALLELSSSTSIEVNPKTIQIAPEDERVYEHPFSVLILEKPLPKISSTAVSILRRYLSYGGFLLIDDTSANPGGPIYKSVQVLCSRLFPTRPLSPLRSDHSLYRSFFLLERPMGRVAVCDYNEGVDIGEISPLLYCPNDLSGALDRGEDGRDRNVVIPDGEYQRTEAIKLAINIFMYSLTSNYKHDQAHVAKLLEEGRL